MRRRTLLTQVLLVNLLLIGAAVLASAIATTPESDLRDTGAAGLVLGFALALTVAGNVFLLSRRIAPLERLAEEMEEIDLSSSREREPRSIGGPEEVQRLESSFREMMDRLEAERRHGASAALEAQERERARIARDLHDEVNQALTGLVLRIEALRTEAPEELSDELSETAAVAGQAMEELLALARQLRPTALDDLGLKAALAGLVEENGRQSGIVTAFEADESGGSVADLADDVQLVVYRVAQEALSNAVRHANASHIRVRLMYNADGLELRVSDDGRGLPAETLERGDAGGLGLTGMRERALLVGAVLKVESQPNLGTRVRLRLSDADIEQRR
ncbi:MAG TPA: sensor histidine kinase [Solirubrobacterales bacterium]|nr:sensor histidine kinase [Solirubrobacterales bacterium]